MYERLESIEDEILIQSVLDLIDIESNDSKEIHFDTTQLQLLEDAKISVRKNGVSNQAVFNKTKEWLKK